MICSGVRIKHQVLSRISALLSHTARRVHKLKAFLVRLRTTLSTVVSYRIFIITYGQHNLN